MRACLSIAVACATLALGACGSDESQSKGMAALKDPKAALTIADAARESGEYNAAIRLYQRVIDEHGDMYEAHMGLGQSLAGTGNLDGAEKELLTAGQLAPTRSEPHLMMGRLDIARHRPAEALVAFDAALILAPDSAAGWNGKGVALDMEERHEEAQQCYRNGLAKAPKDRVLINNYGLSLALSGNYTESVKQLTALAQEPAATARNRQNLALALGLQGDESDAKMVARTDLDEQSVANNLRFYAAAREAPIPKETPVASVMPLAPAAAASLAPEASSPAPAPEAPAASNSAPDAAASSVTASPLPAPATGDAPAAPPPAPTADAPPVPLQPTPAPSDAAAAPAPATSPTDANAAPVPPPSGAKPE